MPTIFKDIVTANDVSFNDPLDVPPEAVVWGLDTMEGWTDSVSLEATSTARGAGSDGEVFGSYFSSKARHMVLGGYVWAYDRESAEELMEKLIGDAFPPNADILLSRYEPMPKQMVVRVTDKMEFTRLGGDKFRWMVPVASEKAFKFSLGTQSYGPVGTAGNSLSGFTFPLTMPLTFTAVVAATDNSLGIMNYGTVDSFCVATLTGPLVRGAWRLQNETTNEYLGFDVSAAAGDSLQIDFENQTATLNGELITSSMFGDFWRLKKRTTNVIKLYASNDPATTISATARSAWR